MDKYSNVKLCILNFLKVTKDDARLAQGTIKLITDHFQVKMQYTK